MSKIYLFEGQCIVYDPEPGMIPFLSAASPRFKLESVQAGPWFSPRFRDLAKEDVFLDRPFFELSQEDLRNVFF